MWHDFMLVYNDRRMGIQAGPYLGKIVHFVLNLVNGSLDEGGEGETAVNKCTKVVVFGEPVNYGTNFPVTCDLSIPR